MPVALVPGVASPARYRDTSSWLQTHLTDVCLLSPNWRQCLCPAGYPHMPGSTLSLFEYRQSGARFKKFLHDILLLLLITSGYFMVTRRFRPV